MDFGSQGRQSSQDCAFHVCTICRAPVRMSYFVVIFFGYQVLSILRSFPRNAPSVDLLWAVVQAFGNELILLGTVLFHEFGHGNMARYLGGSIDHILLWVFGGICFSSRPRTDDNVKLLRTDLLVVAAGPATHFVQAPMWGLLLCLFTIAIDFAEGSTGYSSPWQAFTQCLNPLAGPLKSYYVLNTMGPWTALFWSLVGSAISLNVMLFIFNVFFPMYPADGSKLLVTSLMFCCGVTPRRAALVLICVSAPCAALMILYALWGLYSAVHGGGAGQLMGSLMGWMGVMSLIEANKLWQLRAARRLHTHPLFQTARSWNRRERDAFGVVNRINTTDFDDEEPLSDGRRCFGALFAARRPGEYVCTRPVTAIADCMFPCFGRRGRDVQRIEAFMPEQPAMAPGDPQIREHRSRLLDRVQTQMAQRELQVRDLIDERYAAMPDPEAGGAAQKPPPTAAEPKDAGGE